MRRAVLLACALILAFPASASGASIAEKCAALTAELNERREPDVRVRTILCEIAHARSLQQANGRTGHNLAYVMNRLTKANVCWRSVGEAIAWTTATGSTAQMADHYLSLWWGSDSHRSMLASSTYNQAGGSWRASLIGDGRTYSTLLVMRAC